MSIIYVDLKRLKRIILHYSDLIYCYTKANVRGEVARNFLGYAWWSLEPLLGMLVYYMVFSVGLRLGDENFLTFLLVGTSFWLWFNKSVSQSANSITKAKGIILSAKVSKIVFPLAAVLHTAVKQIVVVGVLLAFLPLAGIEITKYWLLLPILMIVQLAFIAGISLACSIVVPIIPDLGFLIDTVLRLMFFVSGVLFSLDRIGPPYGMYLYYFNPMAGLLTNYRAILLDGKLPDFTFLAGCFVFSILLCLIAGYILRRLDSYYPRWVLK
jgi:homopolymeric O-antigen transport system permease protein